MDLHGPAASCPTVADGIIVDNLYIENGYFFAVKARDAGRQLEPARRDDERGDGPLQHDHRQFADWHEPAIRCGIGWLARRRRGQLLRPPQSVALGDGHAYLFFGGATFAPTTPESRHGSQRQFRGQGRSNRRYRQGRVPRGCRNRQSGCPERLHLQRSGNLAHNAHRRSSRLRDIHGRDICWQQLRVFDRAAWGFRRRRDKSFAIGAPLFNVRVGRVAVVYGRPGFASLSLPDASNTRALEIAPDPALNRSQLGNAVVGLGHFYAAPGTTLVVAAPGLGAPTSTSSNEGRIYAFHGRGPGAAIDVTAADHVRVGPAKGAGIGQFLMNLGPLTGASQHWASGTPSIPSASLARPEPATCCRVRRPRVPWPTT